MIIYLNGAFVSEEQAVVSVFDRSFLFGDGLYETMRVVEGRPFLWKEHMQRIYGGAEALQITLPTQADELEKLAAEMVRRNSMPESVLRITVSRGAGPRGFSARDCRNPVLVMSLHPLPRDCAASVPPAWRTVIAKNVRMPSSNCLASAKTNNRLLQVLARMEADAQGVEESLLLNENGEVLEASGANIFWIHDGAVCTPPLSTGILPGVTRALIMELSSKLGFRVSGQLLFSRDLQHTEGVFLTQSVIGIAEVISLEGVPLPRNPAVQALWREYHRLLRPSSRG